MTIDIAAIEARAREAKTWTGLAVPPHTHVLADDCLALIARLRLADELVAAMTDYRVSGHVAECLRRWHEGEGK